MSYKFVSSIDEVGRARLISVVTSSITQLFGNLTTKIELQELLNAPLTIDDYKNYMKQYNKSYLNNEQLLSRFNLFQTRVKRILKSQIAYLEGRSNYSLGVNQFVDWTYEEINLGRQFDDNGLYLNDNLYLAKARPQPALADGRDWRETNCVLLPENQRNCASCYSFALMSVLETSVCLSKSLNPNKLPPTRLSTQELIDCNHRTKGCDGGSASKAFEYFFNKKFAIKDECYPYIAKNRFCQAEKVSKDYNCIVQLQEDSKQLELVAVFDKQKIENYVKNIGVMYGRIDIDDDFPFYEQGILEEKRKRPKDMMHAIVIVGYGQENGIEYWLIKNSYGIDWGMSGFAKIIKNQNAFDIENNAFGVLNL